MLDEVYTAPGIDSLHLQLVAVSCRIVLGFHLKILFKKRRMLTSNKKLMHHDNASI